MTQLTGSSEFNAFTGGRPNEKYSYWRTEYQSLLGKDYQGNTVPETDQVLVGPPIWVKKGSTLRVSLNMLWSARASLATYQNISGEGIYETVVDHEGILMYDWDPRYFGNYDRRRGFVWVN